MSANDDLIICMNIYFRIVYLICGHVNIVVSAPHIKRLLQFIGLLAEIIYLVTFWGNKMQNPSQYKTEGKSKIKTHNCCRQRSIIDDKKYFGLRTE